MRPRSRSDFAIAIICALPLEADAVEVLFDETYDRLGKLYGKQPGDANAYINGRIRDHDVVLCYMPRMGKGSAASVASSLRVSYTGVQIALVVGICGGVPYPSSSNHTEISLGDVVISDAVVEYDFGRQYPSGFQRKTDGNKDILGGPDREIRTLLAGLMASRARNDFQHQMSQQLHTIQRLDARWRHPDESRDILFESDYQHKHYIQDPSTICRCFDGDSPDDICEEALENSCDTLGCDRNQVRRRRDSADATVISVHIGKVASADTVMKSGEHRDQIAKKERVIGFEMEGAGVWDNIPCIIIKGVCDYADSHKNKKWQDYAAATAACGLKVFLGYYKIGKNTRLAEQDVQVSINHLNEQPRATTIILFFAFLYFRGILLTLHTRLTRLITPWSELPAVLEDAHLRRFTIPLDTINSWEMFDYILEKHFADMPGYKQVKRGSYVLEDSLSRRQVRHTDAFKACFRPGRRVFMSMLFRLRQHEESTCPSCHAVNLGSGQSDVCCSFCGMQYRRVTEVIEEDGKKERPPSHPSSANANILKGTPDREHVFVGPKTPAEADTADDDVTQFKRVHIVAAPDIRHATTAFSSSESTLAGESIVGMDAAADISTSQRPPLPAPTESSVSDYIDTELESFSSTKSGIVYSIPDDGTPITIRSSGVASLPAPYHSIVTATGPGERTLTSIDGLSRLVMVTRHDNGRHTTLRMLTEEEETNMREERRNNESPVTVRIPPDRRHDTLRGMTEDAARFYYENRRTRRPSNSSIMSLLLSLHGGRQLSVAAGELTELDVDAVSILSTEEEEGF